MVFYLEKKKHLGRNSAGCLRHNSIFEFKTIYLFFFCKKVLLYSMVCLREEVEFIILILPDLKSFLYEAIFEFFDFTSCIIGRLF